MVRNRKHSGVGKTSPSSQLQKKKIQKKYKITAAKPGPSVGGMLRGLLGPTRASALSPLAAGKVDRLLLSPNVRAALCASSPSKVVPGRSAPTAGDAVWCMQWALQPGGLNCYDGYGAPGANGQPHSTSVRLDECRTTCQSLPSCGAIVVKFESNADRMLAAAGEAPAAALVDCYLREEVRVAECVQGSAGYELFTLQRGTPAAAASPTASPTAMPKASPKASPRASPEAPPTVSPRASPTASPTQTAPAKKASVTASPTPQLASPQPAFPRPEKAVKAADEATAASESAADAAELAAVAEAEAAAAAPQHPPRSPQPRRRLRRRLRRRRRPGRREVPVPGRRCERTGGCHSLMAGRTNAARRSLTGPGI